MNILFNLTRSRNEGQLQMAENSSEMTCSLLGIKTVRNENLGFPGNIFSSRRLQCCRSVQTKAFTHEVPSAKQANERLL